MSKSSPPPPDSRVTMIQLIGEYAPRFVVVVTACIVVLLTVVAWLLQGFFGKNFVDVRDLVIIAGLGMTPIVTFFFKPVKKTGR